MQSALYLRQELLIENNVELLRQALRLLETLDDSSYAQSPAGLEPQRAGGHMRHILEFYESLLDGLATGHIDYDARRRDVSLEKSRAAAIAKIRVIIDRLHGNSILRGDMIVWVRMEDAPAAALRDPYLVSSPGRELQTLASHTIHHFALIALILRAHGVRTSTDFGIAPSTLRYLATQKGQAA